MNRIRNFVGLTVLIYTCCGCQTAEKNVQTRHDQLEAADALSSVASALSGKEMTDKELKALGKQIKNDPEARSAVEVISQSLSGEQRIIKYCPLDGKRYAPRLEKCPEHNVELKILDE